MRPLLLVLCLATPAAAMFASPAPPLPAPIQPAPTRVPEPGTIALVALGLGFAAWQVRRRRG